MNNEQVNQGSRQPFCKGGAGTRPSYYDKTPQYTKEESEKILEKRKIEVDEAIAAMYAPCPFSHWIHRDVWRVIEGALLIFGIDPEKDEHHSLIRWYSVLDIQDNRRNTAELMEKLTALDDKFMKHTKREEIAAFVQRIKKDFQRTVKAKEQGGALVFDDFILGMNTPHIHPKEPFPDMWFEFFVSPYHFSQWAKSKGYTLPEYLEQWRIEQAEIKSIANIENQQSTSHKTDSNFDYIVYSAKNAIKSALEHYQKNPALKIVGADHYGAKQTKESPYRLLLLGKYWLDNNMKITATLKAIKKERDLSGSNIEECRIITREKMKPRLEMFKNMMLKEHNINLTQEKTQNAL